MKKRDFSFVGKWALILCVGICWQIAARAQSKDSLVTHTYDTALTSNGFAIYHLNFPQWSLDSGLLVSIKLIAEVSSQYQFTLRNADSAANYILSIGQQDLITSPLPTPFENLYSKQIGTYVLGQGQG